MATTDKVRGRKQASLQSVRDAFEVAKSAFGENVSIITTPSKKDLKLVESVYLTKNDEILATIAGSTFLDCVKVACVLAGIKVVPSDDDDDESESE